MKQEIKPYFVYPPVMALALYTTVLGYMIPAIRDAFSLSLAQAGLFSTLQSIGTALSVLLCFSVFSALNKTRIMTICAFLLAIVIIIIGISDILLLLYALFLLLGLFNNIVDTLSNAIIADLTPQKKSFHIGLMQALWSAAGAAGPFFAMLLGSSYTPVFLGLGIFTALCALVFYLALHTEAAMPFMQKRHNLGGLGKLLRTLGRKGLKLYLAAAILNAIVQITMVYFISSYVTLIGGSALQSAVALSALFLGTMAGRLVYAQLLCCKPARKVLPIVNVLALAAFAAMLLSTSPVLAIVFAGLGGVGLSMNFPAYLVELCNLVPDDTAAASALVFLGYTLACFAAPPVFGAIGDAIGLQTSLLIGTAVLIPLIVVSMRLHSEPQSA
jgi:fucose permease